LNVSPNAIVLKFGSQHIIGNMNLTRNFQDFTEKMTISAQHQFLK